MSCSIACSTGGTRTLIGKTSKIAANQILFANGCESMKFFELSKVGLPIALASGGSFATPIGNPVSTYVMGYGGYRFRD